VHVHEFGARHLVDPKKLIDSATRLYGEQMDRLWGEFLPVPAGNVRPLQGGERIEASGRVFEVAYTPGHASHHVSYFDGSSGMALVGDTAGVRIGEGGFVMPPTPPPDIDLDAWRRSTELILAWRPETLFLTHFGPNAQPEDHLGRLIDRLARYAELARSVMTPERSEAERSEAFQRAMRDDLRRVMSDEDARSYELAVPSDHCFLGLARYWRKREALQPGAAP
jgi:glyoxylase-like metal-dependent hydrolase (beta-lactamase superfamily II)